MHPPPPAHEPPSPRLMIAVGMITGGAGLLFTLFGAGILPSPGHEAHAPGWVALSAGLAFLLGGLAVLTIALRGARKALQD